MSLYKGKKRFDREQLVFMAEVILASVTDRIESRLPTGIPEGDLPHVEPSAMSPKLNSYDLGALHCAGMALAMLSAQIYDNVGEDGGLGIGDALVCAGEFDKACERWVNESWKDGGRRLYDKQKAKKGTGYSINELYDGIWPDERKHAETFVDTVFQDYLKGQEAVADTP